MALTIAVEGGHTRQLTSTEQADLAGPADRLVPVGRPQHAQDPQHLLLHRRLGVAERGGDRGVRLARLHQLQHLHLPIGQPQAVVDPRRPRPHEPLHAAARVRHPQPERGPHALDQREVARSPLAVAGADEPEGADGHALADDRRVDHVARTQHRRQLIPQVPVLGGVGDLLDEVLRAGHDDAGLGVGADDRRARLQRQGAVPVVSPLAVPEAADGAQLEVVMAAHHDARAPAEPGQRPAGQGLGHDERIGEAAAAGAGTAAGCSSGPRSRQQPDLAGPVDGLLATGRAQGAQDSVQLLLHGRRGEAEGGGDRRVRAAGGDEAQDLELSLRQLEALVMDDVPGAGDVVRAAARVAQPQAERAGEAVEQRVGVGVEVRRVRADEGVAADRRSRDRDRDADDAAGAHALGQPVPQVLVERQRREALEQRPHGRDDHPVLAHRHGRGDVDAQRDRAVAADPGLGEAVRAHQQQVDVVAGDHDQPAQAPERLERPAHHGACDVGGIGEGAEEAQERRQPVRRIVSVHLCTFPPVNATAPQLRAALVPPGPSDRRVGARRDYRVIRDARLRRAGGVHGQRVPLRAGRGAAAAGPGRRRDRGRARRRGGHAGRRRPGDVRRRGRWAGIDARAHAARDLEAGLLVQADLVLAADRTHRAACARLVPACRPRLFTLRQAAALARTVAGRVAAGELPEGAPPLPDEPVARMRWLVGEMDAARGTLAGRDEADDDIEDRHWQSTHEPTFEAVAAATDALADALVTLARAA